MLIPRYRKDYPGEFVLLETKFEGGKKIEKREWIANPIDNHHISGRAAVIGSGIDRDQFDYRRLARHQGGLLGKKRLQTYGSNVLWQDMKLDFTVAIESNNLQKIIESGYSEDNIVYSTARNCIRHAGQFYLVPFTPVLDELSLAVYLAAFDGHQEVFLLGYNNETPTVDKNWIAYLNTVFQSYSATNFILVGTPSNMPATWRSNRNVRAIKYREFVTYCDI
jgi:hypothetical protein